MKFNPSETLMFIFSQGMTHVNGRIKISQGGNTHPFRISEFLELHPIFYSILTGKIAMRYFNIAMGGLQKHIL